MSRAYKGAGTCPIGNAAKNATAGVVGPQDAPPLTLADFTREVSLIGAERLPSAFTRSDGATLLYQGVANTIYGEPSTGKSWIALMAAIEQIRAGGQVLWWDAEDQPTTLARRLSLLRATDLIGHPSLLWAIRRPEQTPDSDR